MTTWFLAIVLVACLVYSKTQAIPLERANLEKVAHAIAQVKPIENETAETRRVGAGLSDVMYFQQKLDHFDLKNKATWQQRYWVDTTNFFGDGPVFLIIGDQMEASELMITNTQVTKYARTYNALVVLVEHRYYGQSIPTADLSNDNLKYLTIEQALEDLTDVCAHVFSSMKLKSSNKWIAFGTLYAGNLAAWLRLKHPSLISGAIASSAPVLAKFEADLYFENVATAITEHDPECTNAIQKANDQLDDLVNTPGGLPSLQEMFRTCSPVETNKDISMFFFNNALIFSETVEFDDNNRLPPSLDLHSACMTMANETIGNELARYKQYLMDRMDYDQVECYEVSYNATIQIISNDTETQNRPYLYQYCLQMGQYETTRSTNQPFGHHVSQQLWISLCNDVFGLGYNTDSAKTAMAVTNSNYGGLNYQGSNVAFVSGTLDPWRDLSITKSSSALYPNNKIDVIEIQGAGSSADFLNVGTSDTDAVAEAKGKISVLIGKYVLS